MINHKDYIRRIFILLLFSCIISIKVSAQKINLTLNLKNGETFKVESITNMETDQSFMGQEMSGKSSILMEYTFKVLEINQKQEYLIKVSFSHIATESEGVVGEYSYNSKTTNNKTDIQSKIFDIVINNSIKIKVNNKGEILEILDLDKIINGITKLSEENDDPMMAGMFDMTARLYGPEVQKGNLESFLSILPKKKVKVGNSWEQVTKGQPGVPIQSKNIYTLEKIDGNLAVVSMVGTVSTIEGEKGEFMNMMEMNYDLSGNLEGRLYIDIKKGLIDHLDSEQYIEGEITLSSDQLPETMTMPMSIKNIVKIRRLK